MPARGGRKSSPRRYRAAVGRGLSCMHAGSDLGLRCIAAICIVNAKERMDDPMKPTFEAHRDAIDPDRIAALEIEARRLRAEYLRGLAGRIVRRISRRQPGNEGLTAATRLA